MATNKVVLSNGNVVMDISSDTVTADKLAKGYTAHDCHGEQITGTASTGSGGVDTSDGTLVANKVVKDYIGYSKGSKIVGTLDYGNLVATAESLTQNNSAVEMAYVPSTDQLLGNKSAKVTLKSNLSNFGDATAADVKKGKTFTSAAGLKTTGTYEESSGGSESGVGLPDTIVAGSTPIWSAFCNKTTNTSNATNYYALNIGKFTAPKDGTYRFTVIGWSNGTSGNKASVSLSTASNTVYSTGLTGVSGSTGVALPYSDADTVATSVDVTMSAGTKVWFFGRSATGIVSGVVGNTGKIYGVTVSIDWDNGTQT